MTQQQQAQYDIGVACFKMGFGDINPWGNGNLYLRCCFNAGYVDAMRGLV